MSQTTLYPVVMASGSGSRLWPLSRVLYPKQFLCLKGDLTMLQTTVNRLHGVECESPVVICNEQHRFIVAEQLRQLNKLTENIIFNGEKYFSEGSIQALRQRWQGRGRRQ